jgi:hypothetical protein
VGRLDAHLPEPASFRRGMPNIRRPSYDDLGNRLLSIRCRLPKVGSAIGSETIEPGSVDNSNVLVSRGRGHSYRNIVQVRPVSGASGARQLCVASAGCCGSATGSLCQPAYIDAKEAFSSLAGATTGNESAPRAAVGIAGDGFFYGEVELVR